MRGYCRPLFIFTVVCSLLGRVHSSCDPGWLSYKAQCVLIQPGHFDISESCASSGGQPVSISSQDMLSFLVLHLQSSSHFGENFWVGLISTEEQLQWEDGTFAVEQPWVKMDLDTNHPIYTWRMTNESSTSHSTPCFAFDGETVQMKPCDEKFGYICVKDKIKFDPIENCLIGATEHSFIPLYSGDCWYRSPDTTKHHEVDAKCAETGGTFMDYPDLFREDMFSLHNIPAGGFRYWTNFIWNGSDIYQDGKLYLNPFVKPEAGNGSCVTLSMEPRGHILYQTECEDYAHVMCARRREPPTTSPVPQLMQILMCPQGLNWKTFRNNGQCYWETSFETSRLSWDRAREFCQAFGGDLASFHSIDEEKIGLSFQYGSLAHPYWIGLRLDVDSETYKWSDGSPLDYENWAPGHPNHQDKRMGCVAMDAFNKHWVSSLCGIMSWFICQAPKSINPQRPIIPTVPPMRKCGTVDSQGYYFEGYCYKVVNLQVTWHRAEEFCDNVGGSLVSIHSDTEIGFLLRLLYEDRNTRGNRMWIGLTSLSGVFRWTDGSAVDLTYWNKDEPNNYLNQEKCCNMYIGNGLWNDENCNNDMGFICKFFEDATDRPSTMTTIDPTIGNCRKGWFAHRDKCFLPVGYRESDRVNWTTAQYKCQEYNGYLASIRDVKEQAFLSYLMQGLKSDVWIGFHDTLQSGKYFWVDNSDNQYTNWGIGEPSFYGITEDCVKMVYDSMDSGVWRDDECNKVNSYICQTAKDPDLPVPELNRGVNCLHPEGWLKLGSMCFKMFAGQPSSWKDANLACQAEGAELVSISSYSVQAIANYLGSEVNESFWIGLRFEESEQKFKWANNWEMTLSKWGKGNPVNPNKDGVCFASSLEGTWDKYPCNRQMPFVCQISSGTGPALRKYRGDCPNTSKEWLPTDGSYCYLFGKEKTDWISATLKCYTHGSYLISLHSLRDLERVRKALKKSKLVVPSVYIGLIRYRGTDGFHWIDNLAVDFVNWDEGQPDSEQDNCVEMLTHSLKWRVVPCSQPKHFVCAHTRSTEVEDYPEKAGLEDDTPSRLSVGALSAILVCAVLVVAVVAAGVTLYLRPPLGRSRFSRIPFLSSRNSTSFENALFNVNSSSMEFPDDEDNSVS